jgi:glycosyltransferase involved in cell wall biosynthesis
MFRKIYVVYAGEPADPLCRKVTELLCAYSEECIVTYWERSPQAGSMSQLGHAKRSIIVRTSGLFSRFKLAGYLLWMWSVFRFVAGNSGSNVLYLCINLDAALPALIAAKMNTATVVYYNADNAALARRWGKLLQNAIAFCEEWVSRSCSLTIVPSASRCGKMNERICVVPNSPTYEQMRIADSTTTVCNGFETVPLRVLVSGWLVETRGLGLVLEALRRLPEGLVEWVVAGKVECESARMLTTLPSVKYLGLLEAIDSFLLYKTVGIVAAFYDPSIPINRVAEPNKWLDCAALGVPFITNHGITTATRFADAGACFLIDYGKADELVELLKGLASDRVRLKRAGVAVRSLASRPWDQEMLSVLRRVEGAGALHFEPRM